MSNHVFDWAFGISTGVHLLLLGISYASTESLRRLKPSETLEVVYEQQAKGQFLKEQLTQVLRQTTTAPVPTGSIGGSRKKIEIHIPERSPLSGLPSFSQASLREQHAVVDLTNLADAAGGNPVLLSYFGTIQDKIKATAINRQVWSDLEPDASEGVVHVLFVVASDGILKEASVMSSGSSQSAVLREIALRIVKAAGPFPPFPPSFGQSEQKITIPFEFHFGP